MRVYARLEVTFHAKLAITSSDIFHVVMTLHAKSELSLAASNLARRQTVDLNVNPAESRTYVFQIEIV